MLEVEALAKQFGVDGQAVRAIDDVGFHLPRGQVLTLLGPSGCGKTTTLRSIAGLERPTGGRIAIAGRDVFNAQRGTFIDANDRDIAMVFQSYAIWPQMDVAANVSFPLRMLPRGRRPSAEAIAAEVARVLEIVRLGGMQSRPATWLSGGQQQRLAVARALIRQPSVLLLDEPLSNLDARLREHMRVELRELQKRLGLTMVYVTHDQEEALALSDTVAVMRAGRIEQIGTPEEVYFRPRTAFVADFLGATNMLAGTVLGRDGDMVAVDCAGAVLRCWAAAAFAKGDAVKVSIRPESLQIASDRPESGNVLAATLHGGLFLGRSRQFVARVLEAELSVLAPPLVSFAPGTTVWLSAAEMDCVALPAA